MQSREPRQSVFQAAGVCFRAFFGADKHIEQVFESDAGIAAFSPVDVMRNNGAERHAICADLSECGRSLFKITWRK